MAVPAVGFARLCEAEILDAIERALHSSRQEWIFLRELRVGTGRSAGNLQRLDGFALNAYPHKAMKRVCYEVKTSRADFLNEIKHPLKRRVGMRYSNEFYFVTPAGMLRAPEVPAECGLIEVGIADENLQAHLKRQAGFFHFDEETRRFCVLTIPAPWRDTPGPTWQLVAAMMRHQRRELEERPPAPPQQQKLELTATPVDGDTPSTDPPA
jgi:hypothetical protein